MVKVDLVVTPRTILFVEFLKTEFVITLIGKAFVKLLFTKSMYLWAYLRRVV